MYGGWSLREVVRLDVAPGFQSSQARKAGKDAATVVEVREDFDFRPYVNVNLLAKCNILEQKSTYADQFIVSC